MLIENDYLSKCILSLFLDEKHNKFDNCSKKIGQLFNLCKIKNNFFKYKKDFFNHQRILIMIISLEKP